MNKFATRTILAVSSTGFCQGTFDEGDIREGLSRGRGYEVMISPSTNDFPWLSTS